MEAARASGAPRGEISNFCSAAPVECVTVVMFTDAVGPIALQSVSKTGEVQPATVQAEVTRHVLIAICSVRSTMRCVFQSAVYCSAEMCPYSASCPTYCSMSASLRRISVWSTTAPLLGEAALPNLEVEELAQFVGLEPVSTKRVWSKTIRRDPSTRPTRGVGAALRTTLVEVHRDIDVTKGPELAARRAAKETASRSRRGVVDDSKSWGAI